MPVVSVIVPIYNVERYLRCCLDSILVQTYRDFELLLIDDGSQDKCGDICDEYATKDGRIKVFHKENGGVSSARNLGLENATGKFIMFCDPDDYVDLNWIEDLLQTMDAEGICIGVSGIRSVFSDGRESIRQIKIDKSFLERTEIFEICRFSLYSNPINKIFIKDIIEKNRIKFDENVSYGEDSIFVSDYLLKCNGNIGISSKFTYNYRVDINGSLTHKYVPNMWYCTEKLLGKREEVLVKYGVNTFENRIVYAGTILWNIKQSLNNYYLNAELLRKSELKLLIKQIIKSKFYDFAVKNSITISKKKKLIYMTKNVWIICTARKIYDFLKRRKNQ